MPNWCAKGRLWDGVWPNLDSVLDVVYNWDLIYGVMLGTEGDRYTKQSALRAARDGSFFFKEKWG